MSSRGLNRVTVLGTLCKDPELKHSSNGVTYLYFDLASNYQVKNSHGEWENAVEFIPFTAFGKTAELIAQYCIKGAQLYVEGKIRRNKRQDNNGNNIYETQLIAGDIRFAGGKRKDDGGSSSSYPSSGFDSGNNFDAFEPFPSKPQNLPVNGNDDSDVPF
ncbi:MAG: single-stranded DNA-binding protein [Synergistaceae bacterium]|nr:single-stranded DNA-binding protein [Synergistaceae bacterium]